MNYIKFYKKKLGIPNYNTNLWHIHHINMNRNDNSIENLVCIPKKLHEKLHSTYCKVSGLSRENILDIGYFLCPDDFQRIKDYLEVKNELFGFILARKYLENKQIGWETYATMLVHTALNLGYEVK